MRGFINIEIIKFTITRMAEEKKNEKKRLSRIPKFLLLIIAAAVLIVLGNRLFKKEEQPVAEVVEESEYVLTKSEISEEMEFFGNLEANKESKLSAKTSGRIASLTVKEGDRVKKGQLLAYLHPDQNGIDYKYKKKDFENFEEFRSDQEDFLDEQVEIARKNLEIAEAEEDFAEDCVENCETDEIAEEREERAEAALKAAKRDREAQVQSLKEQSDNLRGDKEIAAQNVADTRILAPYSGVVTRRLSEDGEVVNVSVGDLIVAVADVSSYKATVNVPDNLIDRLSVGLEARVILDGIPGEHSAVVTIVNPKVDPTSKKIEVEITLDSVPENVKVDMFARVFIKFPKRSAYFVPDNFVFSGFKGPYIIADGKEQIVQRKDSKDGETEIAFDKIADGIKISRKIR